MNRPIPSLIRPLVVLGVAAALTACAGRPSRPPELVRLENDLIRLQNDARITMHAQSELGEARRAIDTLLADGRRMDDRRYDHNIYIADRLLKIAEAEGLAGHAESRGQQLAREREGLLLDARTHEADRALAMAAAERREAELARGDAELARAEADIAIAALDAMQARLVELETRQTERGLVVTLGDVLFEVDRADLKPGAQRTLAELAQVLRENPGATVAVEGHTDSTGGRDYNLSLSHRRADAVRAWLIGQGIAPERIVARGLGQDYPVASNGDAAGRQQNRRVEVIIQDRPLG